jgi:drug/metabolite transporter (DMT)-like permease
LPIAAKTPRVYGALVSEVGPGRALVVTYLNPVVALTLGVGILGERRRGSGRRPLP